LILIESNFVRVLTFDTHTTSQIDLVPGSSLSQFHQYRQNFCYIKHIGISLGRFYKANLLDITEKI